jgi:predicted RNase H-related nuclease YkuK (DUF458 family)
MIFKKFTGEKINLADYVRDFLNNNIGEYEIIVGTDSKERKAPKASYITVVCIRNKGKGVHVIFQSNTRNDAYNMKMRLWWEVEYSREVYDYLIKEVANCRNLISIHVDVNSNPSFESNSIYQNVIGYLKAAGIEFAAKPNAPAASFAADKLLRNKKPKPIEKYKRKKRYK